MRNHFFLSAFVVLIAFSALAHATSVPVAPIFIITLISEILFGLHLNHDRPLRVLKALGHAVTSDHAARMRQVH